ncbi:MAG: tetratricopeptide repeat protein, partial [Anaerolineae bacterium]|nr:tetratricopeptide repeat protein [Anaerolineae bacterium]
SVADGVLESWGQIFGIEMQGLSDLSSRAARMRGVFSTRKLLVVLDDVVDASEVQKMLPPMHSESAVIVTTRSTEVARLLANQEQIVSLTPMSRPNSLTIMRGILGRAVVEAQLSDADRVSALLGDLPLALQIGVALCVDTGLTLAELARLLDDLSTRLDYLQTGNRATVRLAFEQSWNMLDTVLRRAFAVLAVFEGRMFSAEDFAACIDMPQANAILLLAQLQRRSLLQCIDSGERQYQQHTLLAAYATEKLLSEDDAWLRFSHYFYTFAAHHLTNNLSFQDCWEQVMAGMQTAHRLQKSSLVLDYWQLLHPEWKQRGHYSSTRQSAAWALDAAEIEGDVSLQAAIALAWGVACLEQTDYVAAQQHLNNALDAFGLLRDDLGIADTHYQLSRVMLEQGESSSAETAIQLAWQHYQAVEDVRGMGRSLYRRANIHCYRGDFQPAISLLDDAVRWLSDVGDSRGLLRTHILATRTHSELGNLEQAQVHCAIASELSDQLNERAESASFYYSYAALCRTQGDYSRAHDFAQKALALFREMYDVKSEANALNLLAGIEMHWNRALPERREFENGLAYCQQGIALCDRSGYTLGKAFLLLINGHLLLQRGELQHACQTWWRGFEVARDLEHAWLQVRFSQLAEEHGC